MTCTNSSRNRFFDWTWVVIEKKNKYKKTYSNFWNGYENLKRWKKKKIYIYRNVSFKRKSDENRLRIMCDQFCIEVLF